MLKDQRLALIKSLIRKRELDTKDIEQLDNMYGLDGKLKEEYTSIDDSFLGEKNETGD